MKNENTLLCRDLPEPGGTPKRPPPLFYNNNISDVKNIWDRCVPVSEGIEPSFVFSCSCGHQTDGLRYQTPSGCITHNLIVHWVEYHYTSLSEEDLSQIIGEWGELVKMIPEEDFILALTHITNKIVKE